MNSNKREFLTSAEMCCKNANRLLDEAQLLEYEKPLATHYYLSMIAQEEAAKGFILYLVAIEVLPWSNFLWRATRDHGCKQLVGIVLDYISDMDSFLRWQKFCYSKNRSIELPSNVKDAIFILCHEKIGRWESQWWVWEDDPEYDEATLRIFHGERDKGKQRSLYVGLNKAGQISSTPNEINSAHAINEYERARRFVSCVEELLGNGPKYACDLDQVEQYIRAVFAPNKERLDVGE